MMGGGGTLWVTRSGVVDSVPQDNSAAAVTKGNFN